MMLARWTIDARFGHKQKVIESLSKWHAEIGRQIGWTDDKVRLLTGSIGAPESSIVSEIQVEDLAELNASWDRLAKIKEHAQWSKELEPHIVNGTHRWEIFRVV